jgi:hypothetical protein
MIYFAIAIAGLGFAVMYGVYRRCAGFGGCGEADTVGDSERTHELW